MPAPSTITSQLAAELGQLAPSITIGVKSMLGLAPDEELTAETAAVLGYHLIFDEAVFTAYLVTPGRFLVFELNIVGQYLIVAWPLSRIRRVAETTSPDGLKVTVELDADRATLLTRGEELTTLRDAAEDGVPGGPEYLTRTASETTVIPSGREIFAGADDAKRSLATFARALRNTVGA